MREIKFRVWDREERECLYAEPIYGFFPNLPSVVDEDNDEGRRLRADRYGDIQQFTGLLDKNGKEIYELDTLQTKWGGIGQVVFHDGGFCVAFEDGEVFKPLNEALIADSALEVAPQNKAEVFEAMKDSARESQPESLSREPEPVCPECGGSGFTTIPASQVAGQIKDSEVVPCICQKKEE